MYTQTLTTFWKKKTNIIGLSLGIWLFCPVLGICSGNWYRERFHKTHTKVHKTHTELHKTQRYTKVHKTDIGRVSQKWHKGTQNNFKLDPVDCGQTNSFTEKSHRSIFCSRLIFYPIDIFLLDLYRTQRPTSNAKYMNESSKGGQLGCLANLQTALW